MQTETPTVRVTLPVREVRKGAWTTYETEWFEVAPCMLIRYSTGRSGRYYYHAHFAIPEGALKMAYRRPDDLESAHIHRKSNPGWMPPREGWEKNVFRYPQPQEAQSHD